MAGSISITEGAGAAFGFWRRSCFRVAAPLVLTGLLSAGAMFALLARDFSRAGPFLLAELAAALMAQGALFRIARAQRQPGDPSLSPGFGGFQWGWLEWRLLAVVLLRGLVFGLLGALFLIVLAALYTGLAAAEARSGFAVAAQAHWRPSLDPMGWTVVSLAGLAGTAGLCWVWLRLYLALPATVALGRVQVLSTWGLTQGRAWRILGAVVLVLLPGIGVAVTARVGREALALGGWGSGRLPMGIYSLIIGLDHAFLMLPLSVGLMTHLYDRLGPEDAGVS